MFVGAGFTLLAFWEVESHTYLAAEMGHGGWVVCLTTGSTFFLDRHVEPRVGQAAHPPQFLSAYESVQDGKKRVVKSLFPPCFALSNQSMFLRQVLVHMLNAGLVGFPTNPVYLYCIV